MDEETAKVKIVSDDQEDVTLYSLFSNPVKDLLVFVVLFLLGYFIVTIFTIKPTSPQYITDSIENNVQALKVDISSLEKHRFKKINWHGLPIGIYKRTNVDFENLNKKPIKQVNPADNSKIRNKLTKYLNSKTNLLDDKLRSLKDEYFVFIMVSPFRGCKLVVQFFHDGSDKSKNKFAKIFSTCTQLIYLMNGKLAIENFTDFNQFRDKIYTNYLLIPNYKFIDENTIELIPNE